jgi:hypothetical protein
MLLALAPSAYLAWTFRDMPQFGEGHDDAILFSSAKSMVDGRGYRISSLPGEPFQTKYPPVYPALLATIWRAFPNFPENLEHAMAVAWLPLPILAGMSALFYRRLGVPYVLAALVVLNPYTVLFAMSLRTELLFTSLLIAALLLLDKRPLAAGILVGIAYITRTAGIALVVAALAVLLWRRDYRKALPFTLGIAPFVIAWTWWVGRHRTNTDDLSLLYYVDYLRFGLSNQDWTNIHLFLWKNAWAMIEGIGGLFLVDAGPSPLVRGLLVLIAAAVVAGLFRSAREPQLQPYLAFAGAYAGILLVWHFPPGERFLFPAFPLFIYGAYVELRRLTRALRSSPQLGAAIGIGSMLAIFAGFAAWSQIHFLRHSIPSNMAAHRANLAPNREAFSWMKANVPETEAILAYNDPVVYLYTGRHAMNIITPPRYYYEDRHDRMLDVQYGTVDFAIRRNLRYIYYDKRFRYVFTDDEQASIFERIEHDPRVSTAYRVGPVRVLRVSP